MKSKVSIVQCESYDSSLIHDAVAQAVESAGGLGRIIKAGDRVLLKANLLNASPPEQAVVTHPEVTRAMIRLVKQAGGVPLVGDAPGLDLPGMGKKVLRTSGTIEVCEQEGAEPVLFTDHGYDTVDLPDSVVLKTLHLSRAVREADVVIGMSKAKSHLQAFYTGAIKNFFGVIPQHNRKTAHALPDVESFSQTLVDIFAAVRPAFGIMDAVVGMEGRGPSAGRPRKLGLILASADLVALDAVTCACMGYDKLDIPHIRQAAARGMGNNDLERIEIVGPPIDLVRQSFELPPTSVVHLPGFLNKLAMKLWTIDPKVTAKCVLCGHCEKICPVDAITMGDKKAIIDFQKCIRCFCCHELCPDTAISEKRSLVVKIYKLVNRD